VRHSKTATTILGAGSLVIGGLGLHDAVDWAVNRVWHSTKTRPFWLMKARGVAIILWVVVFAVLSLGLAWLWGVALGRINAPGLVVTSWVALFPSVIVDVMGFTALYKFTPTVQVRLGPALVSGCICALLWEGSKIVFGWWVLEEGSYNRVYGPLAASVIVMLWLWVSAMIFLYGAALSATAQSRYEAQTSPAPAAADHP
jgi:membrane protein